MEARGFIHVSFTETGLKRVLLGIDKENPQMLLHIIILAIIKDSRSHVRILDTIIGQQSRRQIVVKIHMRKSLSVLPGDFVVTAPKPLLFVKLTWINPRASICGSRRRAALGGRTHAPADTPPA